MGSPPRGPLARAREQNRALPSFDDWLAAKGDIPSAPRGGRNRLVRH